MMDAIGPIYRAQSTYGTGASAGYRGQIGRNAAIPHALANNIIFREGDVLVTGAGATMWGYNSELERTMVIGKASDEVKTMFEHMLALQETAFDAIKPGEPCSSVDQAVRAYYEKHDLMPYWKHHVGHNIGLRYHEAPFLDIGDETILRTGDAIHGRAGAVRAESRRFPPQRHGRGDGHGHRDLHLLSARSGKPDDLANISLV